MSGLGFFPQSYPTLETGTDRDTGGTGRGRGPPLPSPECSGSHRYGSSLRYLLGRRLFGGRWSKIGWSWTGRVDPAPPPPSPAPVPRDPHLSGPTNGVVVRKSLTEEARPDPDPFVDTGSGCGTPGSGLPFAVINLGRASLSFQT